MGSKTTESEGVAGNVSENTALRGRPNVRGVPQVSALFADLGTSR